MKIATCYYKVLLLIGLAISSVDCVSAQEKKPAEKSQWASTGKKEDSKKGIEVPLFSQYELVWNVVETHQYATLRIQGEKFKAEKRFEKKEPFFNVFEEKLEPGIYSYSISFVPNELHERAAAFANLKGKRKDLLSRRAKEMEAGNRDAAKALLKQANNVRTEATELEKTKSSVFGKNSPKPLRNNGRFLVQKDGSVKPFADHEKEVRAKRKKENEARIREERLQAGGEESSSQGKIDY